MGLSEVDHANSRAMDALREADGLARRVEILERQVRYLIARIEAIACEGGFQGYGDE